MDNTLIVYDNEGTIFYRVTGIYTIPKGGLQYLEAQIPEGKQVVSVNVNVIPHEPVIVDSPLNDIDLLKQDNMSVMLAVAELGLAGEQNKIEMQLAIAELALFLTGGAEDNG